VLASDRREPVHSPVPEREAQGVLAPLNVLTWGGARSPRGRTS
jgi:hypothetical protein